MTVRARVSPWVLVLALGLALYLPGLGREILRHPLEAKYAMAARGMVAGGPWLVARLFGELYPDKPPLYFWATASVAELRGGRLDEVTARIPAVIGALASLALTLALGEALFGRKAALVSGLVLATSGLFFWYARQGHPDQFLVAAVTGACLGLWKSFEAPERAARTGWVALAYLAMAVGVLSKGLLGVVLPLLAGALYLGVTGPLRALPRRLGLWPGLPLTLVAVSGWYAPAVARHGTAYLRETLVHQQVERYARSWVHQGPWYQYFGDFMVGFLPWSVFVPGAIVLAWRAWRGGGTDQPTASATLNARGPAPWLFPLCWLVAGLVFFSLSTGKRAAYLLPLYPAAALLVGWLWVHATAPLRRSRWLGAPIGLIAGGAGLLAAVAAVHGLGGLILPRHAIPGRMVDTIVPANPTWQLVGALILLAGATAVWLSWRRGHPDLAFAAIVGATACGLLAITLVRAPQYEARYPVHALSRDIADHVPRDERVLSLLADYDFLVAFYLDREIVPLPGPPELLAARRASPRFALFDRKYQALLTEPGVTVLTEGRLGPKRIFLVRLDKAPG